MSRGVMKLGWWCTVAGLQRAAAGHTGTTLVHPHCRVMGRGTATLHMFFCGLTWELLQLAPQHSCFCHIHNAAEPVWFHNCHAAKPATLQVQEIQSLARDLGLTCVEAHKADSVEAVTGPGAAAAAAAAAPAGQAQVQGAASGELGSGPVGPPPYPPGSFSHVLLDPPCSALGLRPRLLHSWTLPQVRDNS